MLRRHALLSLLALSIGTTLTAQSPAPLTADTVLWKFAARQDVTFMRLTPFGTVVVGMPDRVVALDPATGQPIWTREDVKNLSAGAFDIIPLTPYGVVRSRNSVAVLDVQTGATLWDSSAVPLDDVRGYLPVLEHRMLLVYGHKKPDGRALVAMDIDSGKVRWRQHALLRSDPELWETDDIHSLSGHQPPLVDSDTTLILYISKDGPFKIHAATGQLLWRVDQLQGEDPPTLAKAYPPMTLGDAILLVPYGKRLMAVNPTDGHEPLAIRHEQDGIAQRHRWVRFGERRGVLPLQLVHAPQQLARRGVDLERPVLADVQDERRVGVHQRRLVPTE